MPKEHREYGAWNGERFLAWAAKIEEHTKAVVQSLLSRSQVEQQGYKSCIALLKLSDSHSVSALEQACAQALSFTCQPSLKTVQILLKSGCLNQAKTEPVPDSQQASAGRFARGKDYYRRKEDDNA